MPRDDLIRLIRPLDRSTKILKRVFFIRYSNNGEPYEFASKKIRVTKMMGYLWQER